MDRILLIDDDVALTDLLSEALQSEGFGVDIVHCAEDGILKVAEGGYSLLIPDVMLPRMNSQPVGMMKPMHTWRSAKRRMCNQTRRGQ
jgi:DNA-binding response OmpR family regulator